MSNGSATVLALKLSNMLGGGIGAILKATVLGTSVPADTQQGFSQEPEIPNKDLPKSQGILARMPTLNYTH